MNKPWLDLEEWIKEKIKDLDCQRGENYSAYAVYAKGFIIAELKPVMESLKIEHYYQSLKKAGYF